MLVLFLQFCASKLITSNECIAEGVPSFELVRHRKYSKQSIVTARHSNSLGQFYKVTLVHCNN